MDNIIHWNAMPKEARESLRHFLSAAAVFKGLNGNPDMRTRVLEAFDEWFALGDAVHPVTSEVQPAQPEEPDTDNEAEWRRLAMQFDGHRMQALGHLRILLDNPEKHAEAVRSFLSVGPLDGDSVLAERLVVIAASQPAAINSAKRAQKAIQLARRHLMQLGDKVPTEDDQELIDSFHALTPLTISQPIQSASNLEDDFAIAASEAFDAMWASHTPEFIDGLDKRILAFGAYMTAKKAAISQPATQHLKDIYAFLTSIAPEGIADEAFRNVPNSLLPHSFRTEKLSLHAVKSDQHEKRLGFAQQDRNSGRTIDGALSSLQPVHPAPCNPICEVCANRGYIQCANTAKTTALPNIPQPVQPASNTSQTLVMQSMESEDGIKGWYIDGPDFYCDIDREPGEPYSIFIRHKDGTEGFAELTQPVQTASELEQQNQQLREQNALLDARCAKYEKAETLNILVKADT